MVDVAFLHAPARSDDESARLQEALAGHLECEQLTARRRFLTSLLALMSVPVWAMAFWPRLLQGPDRSFILYLFGALLLLTAGAALEEWRASHRLRGLLEGAPEGPGRPRADDPAAVGPLVSARNAGAAAGRHRL